jgi:two-component system LytT family response regulator
MNKRNIPKIRALIVDDEPLAREGLRQLLAAEHDVEVVADCADGFEAIAEIERTKPDLMFLDVQMPELDGFEVVSAIKPELLPAIIFVTAYDKYALRAFDTHAVDYLLKPVDPRRLSAALGRARDNLHLHRLNGNLLVLLQELQEQRKSDARFLVKSAGRAVLVKAQDIDWISAEGDYACLHTQKQKHLLRETLNVLQQQLDPAKFIRIHRSMIVNIDRIKELELLSHGDAVIVLKDGSRLTLSRNYRQAFAEMFGNRL